MLFALLTGTFILLYFALPFKTLTLFSVALMGFLGFATVPGMQLYVIQLAEKHLKGAEDVTSVLNISAFNVGIATGSYLGAFLLTTHGLKSIALMSAVFAGMAIVFSIISIRTETK